MRSPRLAVIQALVLVLVLALAPASGAAEEASGPGLGDAWSLTSGPTGPVLVYRPDAALPLRDARPEFRDGDKLLGYPVQRDGRLELALSPAALAALQSPSAWLSGRRLDGPTPAAPITREPAEAEALPGRLLAGKEDPGAPGPYSSSIRAYALEDLVIDELPVAAEVVAEVIAPVGAPTPMPLVLFLHGRHDTCYGTDPEPFLAPGWPCPEGTLPLPSYQGYRYAAELLASQGYLTVSISANAINAWDDWTADGGAAARSALVRHHLGLWAGWNANGGDPWGGRFQGAVDLDHVILVGHSRGGEGVERAAIDAGPADPYTIVGLVPIGPTSFGRQVGAGIATAVILPYCDGDVVDLQGQTYIDQSRDLTRDRALRSAVLAMGTNHNFYNTEWTPGLAQAPAADDWLWAGAEDDPSCGPLGADRLTPGEQQAVGATYIAALVRVAVHRDAAAASLLDGSRVRAASTGRARVHTHALGGRAVLVYRPTFKGFISTAGLSASICRGYLPSGDWGFHSECAPIGFDRLPHWLTMMNAESAPSPLALELQWRRIGGTATLALGREKDLSRAQYLDLRLAVDPAYAAADLGVRLIDRRGAVLTLPAAYRVASLPGTASPLGKVWARTLRFDLPAAPAGFDPSAIAALEVFSRSGRGHAWLLDVTARRPGVPAPAPVSLPRVSVGSAEIAEGGPGERTEYIPLEIRGEIVRPAVLWVSLFTPQGQQGFRLVLPPGTTEAGIPITVGGNDEFDPYPREYSAVIKALSQVTTGRYQGGVTIIDDEEVTVAFAATRDRVVEGGTLVFKITLSEPVGMDLAFGLSFGEVPGKPILYTDDVTPEFLLQLAGWIPDPPEPFGSLWARIDLPAGATTATFEIPTVADGIAEGREHVAVTLQGWDVTWPAPITVPVQVRDP